MRMNFGVRSKSYLFPAGGSSVPTYIMVIMSSLMMGMFATYAAHDGGWGWLIYWGLLYIGCIVAGMPPSISIAYIQGQIDENRNHLNDLTDLIDRSKQRDRDVDSLKTRFVNEINRLRTDHGMPPLTADEKRLFWSPVETDTLDKPLTDGSDDDEAEPFDGKRGSL